MQNTCTIYFSYILVWVPPPFQFGELGHAKTEITLKHNLLDFKVN